MPSSASPQLNSNHLQLQLGGWYLFSDNTATHPTGKVVKWNKTSNTSIEEFKYLPSSVSTQYQLQLSLNSTQSQLNSISTQLNLNSISTQSQLNSTQSQLNSSSTQTTDLGTTQLKLVRYYPKCQISKTGPVQCFTSNENGDHKSINQKLSDELQQHKSATFYQLFSKWTQFCKSGPILQGPITHLMGPVPKVGFYLAAL